MKQTGKLGRGGFCVAITALLLSGAPSGSAWAAPQPKYRPMVRSAHVRSLKAYHHASAVQVSAHSKYPRRSSRYHHVYSEPAVNPTLGDISSYDDPVIRDVAVDALGKRNGAVLAVDPQTGRILTMVNQHMVLSEGFEPCSTIKPVIAVAALQKGIISRDSMLQVGGRHYMDLTEALAHSNNAFFEHLGMELGFDTVRGYAQMFGLGEKAALNVPGETAGSLTLDPPPLGVAHMSSFGSGIRMTALQLASMASAMANGGTLFYLQWPHSEEFTPQVKRELDIASLLPDVREGMLAAVLYGTARQSYDPEGDEALGKTGTCSDETVGGRIGWFASYINQANPRLALVVLLRGHSSGTNGPRAADVAGKIYRGLREKNYFNN
jgi:penicillin-binding protein 2